MDIYTIDCPTSTPSNSTLRTARNAIIDFIEGASCKVEEYDVDTLANILATKWVQGSGNAWDVICASMESHRI